MLRGELSHPFLDKERNKIRLLFDRIAPRYDLLNHLLSFNLDRAWRRRAVRLLPQVPDGLYLDACGGTGDLSYTLLRRLRGVPGVRVLTTDFSVPMLRGGHRKRDPRSSSPAFLAGDTLRLPFSDATFDGAAVAFGMRNVEDLEGGLRELRRVIKQGGRLVILEFTRLRSRWLRPAYDAYTHVLLPAVGNAISGSREKAYSYLQRSVDRWPTAEELGEAMKHAGFHGVRWESYFPGNVAAHAGYR